MHILYLQSIGQKCFFLSDFKKVVYQLNYRPECRFSLFLAHNQQVPLNVYKRIWIQRQKDPAHSINGTSEIYFFSLIPREKWEQKEQNIISALFTKVLLLQILNMLRSIFGGTKLVPFIQILLSLSNHKRTFLKYGSFKIGLNHNLPVNSTCKMFLLELFQAVLRHFFAAKGGNFTCIYQLKAPYLGKSAFVIGQALFQSVRGNGASRIFPIVKISRATLVCLYRTSG